MWCYSAVPYSVRSTPARRKHCAKTIPGAPALPTVVGVDTMNSEHSTMTAAPPRMRASDSERSATIDVLQDAMTRGLLTHEEGDERMAAVFAARFRDELPPLTADLPPVPPRTAERPAPTSWRGLLSALVALVRAEVAATAAAGFRSR